MDQGPLIDRARDIACESGAAKWAQAFVAVTSQHLTARPLRPRVVALDPDAMRLLSRAEVDALVARQLASGNSANRILLTLLVFAVALSVAGAGTIGLLLVWLREDRRTVELTGQPEALVSALIAQARWRRALSPTAYPKRLARMLGISRERFAELAARPLPRPAEDRYPVEY